ncbi:MAG: T9SS type A sorting domain-containing protein [Ignavibacteria bacterium]|nr:T9SS type A sorting domain-containing protein [Ignavibacteria bacterium]
MNLTFVRVMIITFISFEISSSQSITFQRTFRISDKQIGYSIQQTNDLGYIISATSLNNLLLTKIDSLGNQKWTQSFPGLNQLNLTRSFAQLTRDSGFILTGAVNRESNWDISLIKTDKNGTVIWSKFIGTPKNEMSYFVTQTSDNGFVIAGSIQNSTWDLYFVKTDMNGDTLWSYSIDFGKNDFGWSALELDDDGYIFIGSMSISITQSKLIALKLDHSGNLLWVRKYSMNASSNVGYSSQRLGNGSILIHGGSSIITADTKGYPKEIISTGYKGMSVKQTSDGGFIMLTSTNLFKYDKYGSLQWRNDFFYWGYLIGYISANYVEQAQDGGFIITGSYAHGSSIQIFVVKTDSLGRYKRIIVLAPNGGEQLQANSIFKIKWQHTFAKFVTIQFQTNEDGKWHTIVQNFPADSLSYNWTIPHINERGALLRITDVNDGSSFDESNGHFKIFIPSSVDGNYSINEFSLYQNFPNPFNSRTLIRYVIPTQETQNAMTLPQVTLKIYDVLGRELQTLVDEPKPPGEYEIELDAIGFASGVYFYKLQVNNRFISKKMIILQ